MNAAFDVIVLGTGGVGSAALYHAARDGLHALGIDRFQPGHDRGSSHGETRIIRQAYFEHADYVPLLLAAYKLWAELEHRVNRRLLFPVGLLQVGMASGQVVSGVLASAQQHGLAVESLSPNEMVRRFPGFHCPREMCGVFESTAGYLRVEDCVRAYVHAAQERGARFHAETILSWRRARTGYEVTTNREVYHTPHLILAPGAWAPPLLAVFQLPLQVRRKHVYWFETHTKPYLAAEGCPTFLFELPHGVFYGFPAIDALGVKVAEHTGGVELRDPLHDPRQFDAADYNRVTEFLQPHLPGVQPHYSKHSVCFYTMTPDEQFIVDSPPDYPGLAFAAGLSGHGFKFSSVLGKALVDLALTGASPLPIGFLSSRRWGL